MECVRVRQLLSEYIDRILDAKSASLVEEHLKGCDDCAGEHASLGILVKTLGRLEPLEAPSGFLQKVHKRIESPSWFHRVRHFLPFHAGARIPLGWAGAAAAAVLVFIVSFTLLTDEQAEKTLSGSGGAIVAGRTGPVSDGTATQNPPASAGPEREKGVIHLALSMEPVFKEKPLSSENIISVVSGAREESLTPSGLGFETIRQDRDGPEQDAFLSGLRDIVYGMEGRILSEENKTGTDSLDYVTIEIPAVHYQAFFKSTDRVGSFRSPVPDLPAGYRGRVRIRIHVVSPD